MNPPERCPECHTSTIYARKSQTPTYRCQDDHEFDAPVTLLEAVRGRIETEPGQTLRSLRTGLDINVAPQAELNTLESEGVIERRRPGGTTNEWYPTGGA